MMKYQVRINDTMSNKPASEVFDSYDEVLIKFAEVKSEVAKTWRTMPSIYIAEIKEV